MDRPAATFLEATRRTAHALLRRKIRARRRRRPADPDARPASPRPLHEARAHLSPRDRVLIESALGWERAHAPTWERGRLAVPTLSEGVERELRTLVEVTPLFSRPDAVAMREAVERPALTSLGESREDLAAVLARIRGQEPALPAGLHARLAAALGVRPSVAEPAPASGDDSLHARLAAAVRRA